MKHIVHVVESFGAGVLSIVVDIMNQQVKDQYRVSLIYALRAETPDNWQELLDKKIECHFIPMGRAISPVKDVFNIGRLAKLLRRLKPNVVHLHSTKAGALGRIASLLYPRTRYFFSPHGLSFLQEAGRFKRGLYLFVEKLLTFLPVPFIACSESEAEGIRAHLSQDVEVVENAVASTAIPVKSRVNKKLRIGTVGRICAQKNPELFVQIVKACRELPVEFVWVGAGDPENIVKLRQEGVLVTGWLSRQLILERLSSWDIYIQTSHWEGMSIAVIEAMFAGLPTIVTNVMGNRDVVLPGKTGYVANDADNFLKLIRLFVAEPERILSMGQAGRALALRSFSIENMVQKLYQVYRINR